ncbi:MAG: enoyl-CoA hydratase-related protein [Gammaproteobacteria bacterium]|nr:enoyl-CoA hydratase-related protein [Gammaproteobacteria bacterium]
MCDILICAEGARFADTHARVGVVPGWGLSQRLPRLIGLPRAKELSLTGNFLDARTACDGHGQPGRRRPRSCCRRPCRSPVTSSPPNP